MFTPFGTIPKIYRIQLRLLLEGKLKRLILPYNVGNYHWVLAVVETAGQVVVFDGMGKAAVTYLTDFLTSKAPQQSWKTIYPLPRGLQPDSFSCGIRVCRAIEVISQYPDAPATDRNIVDAIVNTKWPTWIQETQVFDIGIKRLTENEKSLKLWNDDDSKKLIKLE